jgi:hypothetical protein
MPQQIADLFESYISGELANVIALKGEFAMLAINLRNVTILSTRLAAIRYTNYGG